MVIAMQLEAGYIFCDCKTFFPATLSSQTVLKFTSFPRVTDDLIMLTPFRFLVDFACYLGLLLLHGYTTLEEFSDDHLQPYEIVLAIWMATLALDEIAQVYPYYISVIARLVT